MSLRVVSAIALLIASCARAGYLHAPTPAAEVSPAACAATAEDPLLACAPVVLQEFAAGPSAILDRPTPFDPEGSGYLADDLAAWRRQPRPGLVPFYASLNQDAERLYLFYGLYYPADWSGPPGKPRIDHAGDMEGALVVAARRSGRVEAVITQAHKLFYLWTLDPAAHPRAASGPISLTPTGRPILFAESGGHGLYALGAGRWTPRGGGRYPQGPAAVPESRLLRIELAPEGAHAGPRAAAEIRPLDQLRAYRDLPRGARPPREWQDRRGLGSRGALIANPAGLLAVLERASRP
ncbi:MAG TPA: hypothetical protein VJU18_16505 [Vicinamibacteria bacterium]|nr:hypothetical protein [Vicinamibacteria bacterium]